MKTGDYINALIQEVMEGLTPKELKGKQLLTLYIFQRKGEKWISLCDKPEDKSEKISSWVNENKDADWSESLKECGTEVF